jgi:creatinine amidohydrolase
LAQQGHGSHADELETSLMLALAPDLVDMTHAEASPAVIKDTPGPLTPSDPTSPNYSRSGSYGDPTLATSAKGETLLAAILDDLNEHVAAFVAKASTAGQGSGTSRSSSQ